MKRNANKTTVGIGWNWAATLGDRDACARLWKKLMPLCVSPEGYATIEEVKAVIEERLAETEEQWGRERAYKRLTPGQRYCLAAANIAIGVGAIRTHFPASNENDHGLHFGSGTINNDDAIIETIKRLALESAQA